MVYLRQVKTKSGQYYQIMLDNGSLIQLGTVDKMLKMALFWKENHPKVLKVVSKGSEVLPYALEDGEEKTG